MLATIKGWVANEDVRAIAGLVAIPSWIAGQAMYQGTAPLVAIGCGIGGTVVLGAMVVTGLVILSWLTSD